MQKFKASFKFPCNLHCTSPQAIEHKLATRETHPHLFGETLFCLIDGTLWQKKPKHYTGVIHLRAAGGKWEKVSMRTHISVESYLERIGAHEATFRGAPRVKSQSTTS